MIRSIVSMAITLVLSTALVHAQTGCTRSSLQAAADSYIEAQKAGDLSKMVLDSTVLQFAAGSILTKAICLSFRIQILYLLIHL